MLCPKFEITLVIKLIRVAAVLLLRLQGVFKGRNMLKCLQIYALPDHIIPALHLCICEHRSNLTNNIWEGGIDHG